MLKLFNILLFTLLNLTLLQPCNAHGSKDGRYGQNGDIQLYRSGDRCIIAILGRTKNQLPHSLLFWSKHLPNEVLIFPNITHFEDAMQSFRNLTPDPSKYPNIKNTLSFDHDTVALARLPGSDDAYPIYIYQKPASFLDTLMKNAAISGNFYSLDQRRFHSVVQFNLDGFKDALFEADKSCSPSFTFGSNGGTRPV